MVENHQILFDSSGGRGVVNSNWPKQIDKKICGYAGGLGPGNIEDEVKKINLSNASNYYWIDMEKKLEQMNG